MEDSRDRSHHPRKDLRGCRQAKTQDPELEGPTIHYKPEVSARILMNRNLQIDRNHPIPDPHRPEDQLRGLHSKFREHHQPVETREIDDQPPRARSLQNDKDPAVVTWSERSRVYGSLLQKGCDLRSKSFPRMEEGEQLERCTGTDERGGLERKRM